MKKAFVFGWLTTLSWWCLAQRTTDAEALAQQGEAAWQAGQLREAQAFFDRCIQLYPSYLPVYLQRGGLREQLQQADGALSDYAIYLEHRPDDPEARFRRGTIAFRLGRYALAREDFTRLLTLPPGETNTIFFSGQGQKPAVFTTQSNTRPMLLNYLGLIDLKSGRLPEALHWLDSAITLDPRQADYYVNRGLVRAALSDTTAARDYRKALALQPQHALALHNLALLERQTGRTTTTHLEEAMEADSSMLHPYLERAYQRLQGGHYKGALDDYNKALALQPRDPDIWLNRGLVKEKLNDLRGAFQDYTQAITLRENYDKAWLNRGNVLGKQGRYAEAVEDYTSAIAYRADYAAAYYNRAMALEKLKKLSNACEDIQRAMALGQAVDAKVRARLCGQ